MQRRQAPRFVLFTVLCACQLLASPARAQSIPEVPFDVDFAGVTVHLTEPGRKRVQQELSVLYSNRSQLQRDLEWQQQLSPLLMPMLVAAGIPSDFRYALLPLPTGNSDPATYWNLPRNHPLEQTLRMDAAVDERRHPLLVTEAVLLHLNQLQIRNNNWVNTLQYHLYPFMERRNGRVNPLYTLLDQNAPALIWPILARKLAFEREEPVFRPAQSYVLFTYPDGEGKSLADIAQILQVPVDRLMPYQSWLLAETVPADKEYDVLVRVTPDEFPLVKSRAEAQPNATVRQPDLGFPVLQRAAPARAQFGLAPVLYAINGKRGIQAQPCDNPITLAYYGQVRLKDFLFFNELTEQDVVRPGEIFYLETKDKRAKVPFHVVQRGQSLRDVAQLYGVRLDRLLRFNRLEPTQRVQPGRLLWLQRKRPRRQPVEYQTQPTEEPRMPQPAPPVVAQVPVRAEPLRSDTATAPAPTVSQRPVVDSVQTVVRPEPIAVVPPRPEPTRTPDPAPTAEPAAPAETFRLHTVTAGQTYYAISRLYGVTVQQLYAWNNLSERVPLEIGQQLIINTNRPPLAASRKAKPVSAPRPKPVAPTATKPAAATQPPTEPVSVSATSDVYYHIVKPGQTVYRVALINKVSIPDLMRWNGLKNYTIEVGQRLIIRKK